MPFRTRKTSARAGEAGYNLVETLVAVAMTGVVILSIMTLFFLGRRNVYSGKQMSAANAVATRVLEDLSLMSAQDIRLSFGLDDTTTLASNTVAGTAYAASVLRATNGTISTATDPGGYLTRWLALVPGSTFANGRVTLVITPANPVNSALPVSTAQVIRIRGFVQWSEGARTRSVSFESSKLQRP